MSIKKNLLVFLLCAVTFFSVSAQEEEAPVSNPDVEPRDEEAITIQSADKSDLLFVQHLEWTPGEYSDNYMVILEQLKGEMYTEVLRRNVQEPFADVSIPAGDYRYRVLGFNVLGRLDSSTDWEYLSIVQALQPIIYSFYPGNFYFDRKSLRIIILDGVNLLLKSDIYLQRRPGKDYSANEEENLIFPSEIRRTELGETAQLIFEEKSLKEGAFDIVVRNPGGLDDRMGPFNIMIEKPFDVNVTAGYYPFIKLFNSSEYVLDVSSVPVSFGVNASFLPIKKDFGLLGVELNPMWSYFKYETGDYIIRSSLLAAHVNILYQYWYIKNLLAFNARAGMGISSLLGYTFEFHTGKLSTPENFAFFSWGAGLSAQLVVFRLLYLEAGVDYYHIYDSKMPMGFLRFAVSTGWRF